MTDVNDTGPNTDAEPVKRKVAEHYLIDAAGAVVEDEEQATGIGYKLVALPNSPFVYQVPGAVPGNPQTMLAIFGAKTLATNETSQARNSIKGAADPQEQRDAVAERFGLIESGKWIDRSREGVVGAKLDLDTLAMAVVQVVEASGKSLDLAAVRAKLDDKDYLGKIRGNAQYQANTDVMNAYAALRGKPKAATTVADLLAV